MFRKTILPVFVATAWISISEFVRNEFFLKHFWTDHYSSMGLVFPGEPINDAMWGVWSLLFATSIYVVAKKFSFIETALLAWLFGFVMMWVVIWNLSVLPVGILLYAIPLSLLEAFVASWIFKMMK